MNRERLEIAAAYLENLAPSAGEHRFDMSEWYVDSECGTSACAMGELATGCEPLRSLGLRLSQFELLDDGRLIADPVFEGEHGYEAARRLFGISQFEAANLFSQYQYPDALLIEPKHVAERIRCLLRGNSE